MPEVFIPPSIRFHDERARALWTFEHARRLEASMTRPELYAAWDAACLGMKAEGRRARKADLAGDLARNDAMVLGEEWHPAFLDAHATAGSEARVRAAGTPTRWADDPAPTADGPCPFSASGDHGWTKKDTACRLCGTDMAPAMQELTR